MNYTIDHYLPKAMQLYLARFSDLERSEQAIKEYLISELEEFLAFFGGLTEDELKQKSPFVQYKAYDLGILVSKKYSSDEIEAKKREYLAMLPLSSFGRTIKRWHYEVERQFESKDFYLYPDKKFLMLDTFRRIGTP